MTEDRLEILLGFLDQDTANAALAIDCAEAALAAHKPQLAWEILRPFEREGTIDPRGRNVAGVAAMQSGDQEMAQRIFRSLLADHPEDPALRFNLAWSQAISADYRTARETLGDARHSDMPQAAMLDLHIDHSLGEFEAAEAKIDQYLTRFPDYPPLQATASVLAMDIDRMDLARSCAEKGGEHPEALATLGAVELSEQRVDAARALFARSIENKSNNPRANVGLGLVELNCGNSREALQFLDRGAEQFGDHLGSWLAAGWAHLLSGDAATARARFETALAIDDGFGEAQGSIAALDALAGDTEQARRRIEIALRLDRKSFAAAFASIILTTAEGDASQAKRIFDIAAHRPLLPDGRTLVEILSRIAL